MYLLQSHILQRKVPFVLLLYRIKSRQYIGLKKFSLFLSFFQLVGCAALGIGIWLLVTDFGARKVTPIVGNQLYEVTTYLLIAGGGAVALLAFCGCCGTIREDKCVLSFVSFLAQLSCVLLMKNCGFLSSSSADVMHFLLASCVRTSGELSIKLKRVVQEPIRARGWYPRSIRARGWHPEIHKDTGASTKEPIRAGAGTQGPIRARGCHPGTYKYKGLAPRDP